MRKPLITAAAAVFAIAAFSGLAVAVANSVSTKPSPAFVSRIDDTTPSSVDQNDTKNDDNRIDDPATHDVNDDNGIDDPATHDVNDDNGIDDPATHDVNDDNGIDDPATHDVNDDDGGRSVTTVDDNSVRSATTADDNGGRRGGHGSDG